MSASLPGVSDPAFDSILRPLAPPIVARFTASQTAVIVDSLARQSRVSDGPHGLNVLSQISGWRSVHKLGSNQFCFSAQKMRRLL